MLEHRVQPKLVALAAAVWLCACGGSLPSVQEAASESWVHLTTEHFDFYSPLGERSVRDQAELFERSVRVVSAFGWPTDPVWPERWRVILLRNERQMRQVSSKFDAIYRHGGYGPNLVVMYPQSVNGVPALVQHEVTHAVAHSSIPSQPGWLAEGLATYLQSASLDERQWRVLYGRTPTNYNLAIAFRRMPSVLPALHGEWDPLAPMAYPMSWALVHFLLDEHPAQFVGFLADLAHGASSLVAFREHFPDLYALDTDPEAFAHFEEARARGATVMDAYREAYGSAAPHIDEQLRGYIVRGKVQLRAAQVAPFEMSHRVETLQPADVHVLLAQLALVRTPEQPLYGAARDHVSEALRHEPSHVGALELASSVERLHTMPSDETLDWVAEAHAFEPRAHLLKIRSMRSRGASHEALRAALRSAMLQAAHPDLWLEEARVHASYGEWEASLARTTAYLEAMPGDREAYLLRAGVLSRLGRCDEVDAMQEYFQGLEGLEKEQWLLYAQARTTCGL